MVAVKRAYLSIEEIAKEYLPMSRKKIRELVTKNLFMSLILFCFFGL